MADPRSCVCRPRPRLTPDTSDIASKTGKLIWKTPVGKVEWDTKVPNMPLGAATVSNDLLFTTLFNGELVALNRATGAIVYHHKLPTSTNAPIAIAGNTVLVPAGGSADPGGPTGNPQLIAYTVP